jgi:hypothetical protein
MNRSLLPVAVFTPLPKSAAPANRPEKYTLSSGADERATFDHAIAVCCPLDLYR